MLFSLNEATIAGKVGRDPEFRTFANGSRICSFSVATDETWNDKASGERKSKTTWHRVAIFNEHLVGIAERFVKKGCTVWLRGSIETRKYTDKDGKEREITEIALQKFRGELKIPELAGNGENGRLAKAGPSRTPGPDSQDWAGDSSPDLDDEIPF